jgi:hypothetical protein
VENAEILELIKLMREHGVTALTIPNKIALQLGPAPLKPGDHERDRAAQEEAAKRRVMRNLFPNGQF